MRSFCLRLIFGFWLWLACGLSSAWAGFEDPFGVTMDRREDSGGVRFVVHVQVPAHHLLYASEFKVTTEPPGVLAPERAPVPAKIVDPQSGEEKPAYTQSVDFVYRLLRPAAVPLTHAQATVSYQGCSDTVCFFPARRAFRLDLGPAAVQSASATNALAGPVAWAVQASRFRVVATSSGFLPVRDFLQLLDQAEPSQTLGKTQATGLAAFSADPGAFLRAHGLFWTALLILLGGLLLNLTPCVLPMIPINLAIIGAGAQSPSRRRGFWLGSTYGLGIALTYGLLGVAAVLTGAQFGAINASPWFNAAVAVVFLILALALFDVFVIDLARLQNVFGSSSMLQGGTFAAALMMGGLSAVLAGACVAPVILAVLLLAGKLYAGGMHSALLWPFLLGLGMALPWPLAAAGLSILPKPGAWMDRVKHLFGVLIIALAAYYGWTAWHLFQLRSPSAHAAMQSPARENERLAAELQRAWREKKPVLLDFWATWCKNCEVMKATTFRDPEVIRRLGGFVFIPYQAEQASDPLTGDVLRHFDVRGLPTYIILQPRDKNGQD